MSSTGSPSPFRIAIVGGGLGGLHCALQIHHHCGANDIEIEVFEQAAKYSEIGAGVGIGANAVRVFAKIGMEDSLRTIGGDWNGIWMSFRRFDNGEEVVTVPTDDAQRTGQLGVQRSELLDLLFREIQGRRAAKLYANKRCKSMDDLDDTVRIHFQDGSSTTANLVIAADGIRSATRKHFTTDNPVYSGQIAYRGPVATSELESWWPFPSYCATWVDRGRHFIVYPICEDNRLLNTLIIKDVAVQDLGDLKETWQCKGTKDQLRKDYEGFEEIVQKIIDLMPERPNKWVLNDREPCEQWTFADGKVVLLGDAAHAMLPHQGAGAGQSIEDGYILARALQTYFEAAANATIPVPSTSTHLNGDGSLFQQYTLLYQNVRRPRAQKMQQTTREAGDVLDLKAPDMQGKSYDECLPIFKKNIEARMKWVWTDDIDEAFEIKRREMGLEA